jgi:hypothetical protein
MDGTPHEWIVHTRSGQFTVRASNLVNAQEAARIKSEGADCVRFNLVGTGTIVDFTKADGYQP